MVGHRVVYHIVPDRGAWALKRRLDGPASSRHAEKAAAVAEAKRVLGHRELGQIIVHRPDGSYEVEWSQGAARAR